MLGRSFACCVLLAAALAAQETKPAEPAKKEGYIPGPFTAHIVLDQRTDPAKPMGKRNVTGKEHCLVTESELNPTLAIFSGALPAAEGNLTKLAKKAKDIQAAYKAEDFSAFALFHVLTDDFASDKNADKSADALRAWADGVKPGGVVIALGTKGPDDKPTKPMSDWKLSPTGTSAIFFHKHKIVKRWDFAADADITEATIAAIAAEVDKEMKKK